MIKTAFGETNYNNKNYNYRVKKAASKLLWRFKFTNGLGKSFKPNKDDVESLNTLLECINREKKVKIQKNVLFAKLFIYVLTIYLREYKTTIFNKMITKEVSYLLDKPLDLFYKAFEDELYNNQINDICEIVKLKETGRNITVDDFKKLYSSEYIQQNLDLMITEALNRFEN